MTEAAGADAPAWQPPLTGTDAEQVVATSTDPPTELYAHRLRDAVDGYTDEDPAPDWRPVWL